MLGKYLTQSGRYVASYTTLRRNLSVQQNWSGTDQKVRVEDERKMRETGRWGDAGGGAREVVE